MHKKTSAEWNPADCIVHCADYIAITMENPADNYADNPTEVACVLSVASSLNRNLNFVEVARIRHNQSKTLLLRSLNRNFLPILNIDTACRVLDLATLEVVVNVSLFRLGNFDSSVVFPEDSFFLLVEYRVALLHIKE